MSCQHYVFHTLGPGQELFPLTVYFTLYMAVMIIKIFLTRLPHCEIRMILILFGQLLVITQVNIRSQNNVKLLQTSSRKKQDIVNIILNHFFT